MAQRGTNGLTIDEAFERFCSLWPGGSDVATTAGRRRPPYFTDIVQGMPASSSWSHGADKYTVVQTAAVPPPPPPYRSPSLTSVDATRQTPWRKRMDKLRPFPPLDLTGLSTIDN
jgi:hypothetical protein